MGLMFTAQANSFWEDLGGGIMKEVPFSVGVKILMDSASKESGFINDNP